MSGITREEASLAFAAWLGAMLQRHADGKRMLARPGDEEFVTRDSESFGVVWPAYIAPDAMDVDRRWEPRVVTGLDRLYERAFALDLDWSKVDDFHQAVIARAPSTLPAMIVRRLIDRGNPDTIHLLGHLPHRDPEQWSLTNFVPEAVEVLAGRRYCNPAYRDDQLEEVLHSFRSHTGLPDWLGRYPPASHGKADLAARYAVAAGEDRPRRYHHPDYAAALAAAKDRR